MTVDVNIVQYESVSVYAACAYPQFTNDPSAWKGIFLRTQTTTIVPAIYNQHGRQVIYAAFNGIKAASELKYWLKFNNLTILDKLSNLSDFFDNIFLIVPARNT